MKQYDIIIVGGGASGLTAAVSAARAGAHPVLLESGEKPGKKILATGNGRCNYTNRAMSEEFFHCVRPGFVRTVLSRFDEEDTLRFFESLGIPPAERNGYIYPRSGQAASVRDAFLLELDRLGAEVVCGAKVTEVRRGKDFQAVTREGDTFRASRLILAAGGCAAPKTGSDGSGYELARQLGHRIRPPYPSLVQLVTREKTLAAAAGVRAQAKVTIRNAAGKPLDSDTGELMITSYGISGIPVFQVSHEASRALLRGQKVTAVLDFLPEMTDEEAARWLKRRRRMFPDRGGADFLTGVLPDKLAATLTREAADGDLLRVLKHTALTVTDTMGFENAQVCGGGADTAQIDPASCESRLVPGLYLTGELMDVDGRCGGYNLQWAWSTGWIAGRHAAMKGRGNASD